MKKLTRESWQKGQTMNKETAPKIKRKAKIMTTEYIDATPTWEGITSIYSLD